MSAAEIEAAVRPILAGASGIEPQDAESILAEACRMSSVEAATELARRCAAGEPLGYVLGRQTFMGVDLHAGPGALAPRAETEILGSTALELLRQMGDGDLRVIDMCCGAGNLACAIATHLPRCRVWASDLTDGCVTLARRNVVQLGLERRVEVAQGDLFAPLAGLGLEGTIDAVVCNPPYISAGRLEKDRASLLAHEPREAFDGGPYGLSIHQRVIREALPFLRKDGWLLFEFGLGQERQLQLLFARPRAFDEIRFARDAAGTPRVAYARKQVD